MLSVQCTGCDAIKRYPLRESHQLFEGLVDDANIDQPLLQKSNQKAPVAVAEDIQE